MLRLLMLLTIALLLWTNSAHALIRPIFVPAGPMAIINLEGSSPYGMDPEPRDFYDSIALPPSDAPNGAGKGKVISVDDKSFTLSCGDRGNFRLNIICSLVVKATPRSLIDVARQTAEVKIEGDDAKILFAKFAGPNSESPFLWQSKNGWVHVEAHPNLFWFKFTTYP